MAGLYGIFSPDSTADKPLPCMFAAGISGNDIRNLYHHSLTAGLAAEPSFHKERVLESRDHITIGFYGFLFQPSSERADLLFDLYRTRGTGFIPDLDGYFSGFIHDSRKKKLYLFTDHLSTRPLYYGMDPETGILAFSGDAHHAAALLRTSGSELSLNLEALS